MSAAVSGNASGKAFMFLHCRKIPLHCRMEKLAKKIWVEKNKQIRLAAARKTLKNSKKA